MEEIKLCQCGCGQPVKRKTYWPHTWNDFIKGHNGCQNQKPSPIGPPPLCACDCGCQVSISATYPKKWNKYLYGHNLERYTRSSEHQSKAGRLGGIIGGKVTRELYPNLSKENMKISKAKYPNLSSMGGKIGGVKGGKRVHELHPELRYNANKHLKDWMKKDRARFIDCCRKAGKIGGCNSMMDRLSKMPFCWEGVNFMSNPELNCAKMLLNKPIKGINCHISIGSKIIDFFPQVDDKAFQGCFVEYHQFKKYSNLDRKGLSIETYKQQREEIIENSKYKGTPLIVITDLKQFNF